MTYTVASPVDSRRPADDAPLESVLQCQMQWFTQMVELQSTWLTSCLVVQGDCWRYWMPESLELPAWMVWHNGTEQLA